MSEITHKTLRATIQEKLDLKVKLTDLDQAYALLDLLKESLPKRKGASKPPTPASAFAEEAVVEEPKAAAKPKVKKAKVVSATEAELLAPADDDTAATATSSAAAATLGATDEFRGNKYRLQAISPALCVGRRYDEKNPVVGTRTEDEGANGILFPELQCTKKPVAGCLLCTVCAKNEAEYKENPSKPPKRWYGRLDEPVYATARVIGSEWFLTKYPSGIEGARPSTLAEKPKKAKKTATPPPPSEEEEDEPAAAAPTTKAEKPKKVKKDKAPTPPAEEEPAAAPAPAAKKPDAKKASVASSTAPKDAEWVTFFSDGVLLIRHTKAGNVYQCDQSKHRLEDMVQRDKFEGKWRGGRLDPYGEEDEE